MQEEKHRRRGERNRLSPECVITGVSRPQTVTSGSVQKGHGAGRTGGAGRFPAAGSHISVRGKGERCTVPASAPPTCFIHTPPRGTVHVSRVNLPPSATCGRGFHLLTAGRGKELEVPGAQKRHKRPSQLVIVPDKCASLWTAKHLQNFLHFFAALWENISTQF